MKRAYLFIAISLIIHVAPAIALERPNLEFKIFQFPTQQIPRIDGKTNDWSMVTGDYIIDSEQLIETVRGIEGPPPPDELDIRVRVGWVKGLNRLYFLYEAHDDCWNMNPRRGDIFEVVVDADLSGGQFIRNEQLDTWDNHFNFKGVHAQNYHIFTPPGKGRNWAMIWGCQPWIRELPWSNHAYDYSFSEGEAGDLVLEFWITPFDYAPYEGPERAVVSELIENTIIGLSWAVLDYDENDRQYEGFWNLSHKTRMDSNASCQVAFRLMPIEPHLREKLETNWTFEIVDMDRRLVSFHDESYGKINEWLWDFDDGSTSTEQHPVHSYEKPGEYSVTLTVRGPDGESKLMKVRDVAVR